MPWLHWSHWYWTQLDLIAQLVEHLVYVQLVLGSIPSLVIFSVLTVSLAAALEELAAQKEELEIAKNQIDHYKFLWRTDSGLHRFWQWVVGMGSEQLEWQSNVRVILPHYNLDCIVDLVKNIKDSVTLWTCWQQESPELKEQCHWSWSTKHSKLVQEVAAL